MIVKTLQMLQPPSYILRLYAIDKPHSQLYLLKNVKVHLILDCVVICALQNKPHFQKC